MKKKKVEWRVAEGRDDGGRLLAYYVVKGNSSSPKKVIFDHHGAYILQAAAQETCDQLNSMTAKQSKKYDRDLREQRSRFGEL